MKMKKFLAALLSLAMVVTFVPTIALPAFADNEQPTTASLTIGGETTYYQDFGYAYQAIPAENTNADDAVITLLGDHTYSVRMTFDRAFTLDLNGYTFTNNIGQYSGFNVQKNLTIRDTSAGQNGMLYCAHCTGAAIVVGKNTGDAVTLTLKSGCIQSETCIFDTWDNAVINVEGGKMVSWSRYSAGDSRSIVKELCSGCVLNISGGEFRSDQSASRFDTLSFDPMGYPTKTINANSTITVTGGSFSGQAIQKYVPGYTADQSFSNVNPTITVGDYSITRTTVSSPYGAAPYDVYLYTVESAVTYVAQIGDAKYESLADAVAAVPTDGTKTTITMIADEAVANVGSGWLSIAATKNIVLDLNGHVISGVSDQKSAYFIKNYGTLEIVDGGENGKITFSAVPDGSYSKENITIYNNGGTLTLTSGTIENTTNGGATYAVNNSSNAWGNGDDKDSIFNMNGGIISAPHGDAALRVYQNCSKWANPYSHNTVNITDGTILDTGIFLDSYIHQPDANTTGVQIVTSVNISGGEIHGLIDLKLRHPFNTSLNITGGTFVDSKLWVRKVGSEWSANVAEPTDPMVHIEGGKFSFVPGKAFGLAYDCGASSWDSYETPYDISGGKFNVEPAAAFIASGYEAVANTDDDKTTYAYKIGTAAVYVAQIGDVKYETLQDAVDAATDGQTIILLEDITLTKDVHVTTSGENIYCVLVDNVYKYQRAAKQLASLTIDGNGHAITMDANAAFADKYHLSGGCAFFFGKYGTTGEVEGNYTIRNVTFEGFNTEIIRSAFTTVNLENCTFNGNHITVVHGDSTTLLYAYQGGLNVSGCTFTDNTVSGIYGLIFSNNSNSDATITIDHNLFKNNGTSAQPSGGNGLIYFSNAASSTDAITNNTFEGNYVQNASANAAVVYLSKPVETFSGNLFKDNHVDVSDSSKKEGIIVLGSNAAGTPVVGNAFDGNVLVSELPAKRATIVVGCNSDLSSNYWGDGAAAVEGAGNDYYIDGSNKTITITGFATAYAANANANGCTVSVPSYVAQIGDVQYTTLVDAIAAANADTSSDPITITLLADLDFSDEVYAGYKWGNFLAITRSNVTLDLDGHTISNMGNAALAFGYVLAVNGRISNVTIQNGTLLAGQTDGVTNSYVLGIGGVDGALIKNITTSGGFNVYSGSKDIVIDSCNVNGTKYYTICAQTGSDVIIRGTSYTKNTDTTVATKAMFWIQGASTDSDMVTPENPTGAFGASSLTIESGSFAIATADGGQFYLTGNGYLPPVVKGGIFNIEVPAVCIADGYEAVDINEVVNEITYIKQVGKVIAGTNLTPAETPAEDYDATYTVQKKVVDEGNENEVLATGTAREVNVRVEIDEAIPANAEIASGNTVAEILDNLDMEKVLGAVVDAVDDADTTINVQIQVVRDKPEEIVNNTITYEVHPIALIYVDNAVVPTETVTITNDKLESGAVFTVTLPVPEALAALVLAGNGNVKVTHTSADYGVNVMSYPLKGDAGNYYVQFNVSHFSEFELAVDEDALVNPSAKTGKSLVLEDKVGIVYYIGELKDRHENVEADPSRFTVKYTFHGVTNTVALTDAANNRIEMVWVAAKEMTDTVSIEVYYDDTLLKSDTYSVQQYCHNKIEKVNKTAKDEELATLCRAILDYGAAAQVRFEYNSGNLANETYSMQNPETAIPANFSSVKTGAYWIVDQIGASLSLEANTEINFYFRAALGYTAQDYTATVNGVDATIQGTGNIGRIVVPGTAAKNLDEKATLVLTRNDTSESYQYEYAPMTWAYNKQDNATEHNVALALYNYYLAADTYFAD